VKVYAKLKAIRKQKHLTQEYVAQKLGYDPTHIGKMETGKRVISPDVLLRYKDALGASDVPLTDQEVVDFESELWSWRDKINNWLVEAAEECQPDLERKAELSQERDLLILYKLISISFYRIKNDEESAKRVLKEIARNLSELSPVNKSRFLIMRGTDSMHSYRYKAAYEDLFEAYIISEKLRTTSFGVLYNLAQCYTIFGYTYKAVEFILKARVIAKDTEFILNQTNVLLAINYANMGMFEEAFKTLDTCVELEEVRHSFKPIIGQIHYAYAYVLMRMGAYDKSLEQCEEAIRQFEYGDRNYTVTLLLKAKNYFKKNNESLVIDCLDEGISLSKDDSILQIEFLAIKYIINIHEQDSLDFFANTALPIMLSDMRYSMIVEYYEIAAKFHKQQENYKIAFEYMELASKYMKKILESDL